MAIKNYNDALDIDPQYTDALLSRGFAYRDKELWDLVIKDYTAAIEIDSKCAAAFCNRGFAYEKKKLWDLAIKDYTAAIKIDSQRVWAFNARGNLRHKKRQSYLALKDFTKALKIEFPKEDPEHLLRRVQRDERETGLDFTRELMRAGFYTDILGDSQNSVIIKPYVPSKRAVLFFNDLHTAKSIRRHLARFGERYELRFDTDFDAVLKRCVEIHGDQIFTPDFQSYFKELKNSGGPVCPVSFSLYKDGKLAAGDIGVRLGTIYTSYSGYHDEPSAGAVQIVLTARYLQAKGFAFWDFGYSDTFSYKTRLGAKILNHEEYTSIFNSAM